MKSVCAKHEAAYESECPWCEPAEPSRLFGTYVDQMLAAAPPQEIDTFMTRLKIWLPDDQSAAAQWAADMGMAPPQGIGSGNK